MFSSASLLVTEQCNLRCTYCFEEHKNKFMTIETAEKTLDFLFEGAKHLKNPVGITFFGGEPLLNPDVVCYIIREGYNKSKELGIGISFSFITNCTLLPKEVADTIKEYLPLAEFDIQLSIDGTPDIQDEYRIKADGTGSWDMVERTLPLWKEVVKGYEHILHVHGCLNKRTLPYYFESYKFFKYDLNLPRIWFLPICEEEWTEKDVVIYKEQCELIYEDIIRDVNFSADFKAIDDVAPFGKALQPACGSLAKKPCSAGEMYCSITADGDVYPCHQFYFSTHGEQTLLGDVWNGVDLSKSRIFREYDGSDLNCDKSCDHGDCYRCIAVNWEMNQSIIAQKQGYYCALMKVDQHYQNILREKVKNMALLEQGGYGDCTKHTRDTSNGCDIVQDASDKKPHSEALAEPEEKSCGGSCGTSCTCGPKVTKDELSELKDIAIKMLLKIDLLEQKIK